MGWLVGCLVGWLVGRLVGCAASVEYTLGGMGADASRQLHTKSAVVSVQDATIGCACFPDSAHEHTPL